MNSWTKIGYKMRHIEEVYDGDVSCCKHTSSSGDFSLPFGQFEVTCVVASVSGFTFDFSPLFFPQIPSIKCVTSKKVTMDMSRVASTPVLLGTSHFPLVSSK